MRSSGCTIQQALTPEAATMVKQAVNLAKRRGHAQVTPLHVANTMLSSPTGLFRAACSQSHSHPLQCRALELCFNVALNRLPTSTSSPMLGPHYEHQHPTISNALVAAFKRAQAHQRRGSIENQQQPLLAVKIEIEQLIISILDDPSVSRVMREAGFSSPLVKGKVEQAVSMQVNSQPKVTNTTTVQLPSKPSQQLCSTSIQTGAMLKESDYEVKKEDTTSVIEGMLNKRKRCCVVVGECLTGLEGAVRGVMDRVERGDVPEALREVRFEPLSPASFGQLSRDQIVQKFADISCLVKRYASRGLVFYLGDLKWAAESIGGGDQRRSHYCPIEHVIMELKRLVLECNNENGRLWLLGVATFQTYTRCGSGNPSLEAIWGIHAITIPAGSLGLSLNHESDSQRVLSNEKADDNRTSWLLREGSREEKHHVSLQSSTCNSASTTQSLPSWLQKYKDDERKRRSDNDQDVVLVNDLSKRSWSFTARTLSFSPMTTSSSPYGFSYDDHQLPKRMSEATFRTYIPEASRENQGHSPTSSKPNSTSSSDLMEVECTHKKSKDYNVENLEILCNALEKKVPLQRSIIRDIVSTTLSCRSGRVKRKGGINKINDPPKEETWLFFQGLDSDGKEKMAKELARLVFGSEKKYSWISLNNFSKMEDSRNKRVREEQSCACIDKLVEAVSSDPHRVFFVEDIEQVDYFSQVGIKRAMERGKLRSSNGKEVGLGDSIIILSCERFSSRSRACSPTNLQRSDPQEEEKGSGCSEGSNGNSPSPGVSLDLNMSICDDCGTEEDQSSSVDQLGLLASVDKCVLFKIEES